MSESFRIRTDQVREGFLAAYDTYRELAAGWFDRWLDQVKAEARREGQAEAWADAVASAYLHETEHFTSIKHEPNPYEAEEDRHVDQ